MKKIPFAIALMLLTGCVHVPPDLMRPDSSTLQIRSAQSHTFDSCTDTQLLRASVAVLQDMGYNIK